VVAAADAAAVADRAAASLAGSRFISTV
jgi:hypothetical protein